MNYLRNAFDVKTAFYHVLLSEGRVKKFTFFSTELIFLISISTYEVIFFFVKPSSEDRLIELTYRSVNLSFSSTLNCYESIEFTKSE